MDEKDDMIQTLQYQLEKQKRKQFRQERVRESILQYLQSCSPLEKMTKTVHAWF